MAVIIWSVFLLVYGYEGFGMSNFSMRSVIRNQEVISTIQVYGEYMDVSLNGGTPKSSVLIGFSIIFTIHFGVPLF